MVENRIEDQVVAADSFAAVDGVIGEEKHIPGAKVGVDDNGVLSDTAGFIQQAR